jgi:hypothetical protein
MYKKYSLSMSVFADRANKLGADSSLGNSQGSSSLGELERDWDRGVATSLNSIASHSSRGSLYEELAEKKQVHSYKYEK